MWWAQRSSGKLDFVRAILTKVRPEFRVLVGAASILLRRLVRWRVGAVLGLANFAPSLCVGVYEAFLHEHADEARDLQQRLLRWGRRLLCPYGVAGIKQHLICAVIMGESRGFLYCLHPPSKETDRGALHEA